MSEYRRYLKDIFTRGVRKEDRTGVGTISAFGHFLRFDLKDGFPLETLKRTALKPIKAELLWFLEGSTDNNRLRELGATIWDEWALENGELGPIYGAQWRSWPVPVERDERPLLMRLKSALFGEPTPTRPVDQIAAAVRLLREKPLSRRIVISGWNVAVLPDEGVSPHDNVRNGKQALPPCHMSFILNATPLKEEERIQYLVDNGVFANYEGGLAGLEYAKKGTTEETVDQAASDWLTSFRAPKYKLNGLLTQRSSDAGLGAPYNVASYSLLLCMIAQVTKMVPGEFCMAIADGHIYADHVDALAKLVELDPYPYCQLVLNPAIKELEDFTMDDIDVENYVSHPTVKLPVAV